jgi:IS30 family transposase
LRWARPLRRRDHQRLYHYVVAGLNQDWSPEQIAGRLRRDHAGDQRMRVSHETIYQWVYRDAANGGTLFEHLRRHHRRRHKQGRYGTGRGLIPGRISITERPAIVERRARFGVWEGDSVEGAKGKGGIASLVERKSRYLLAAPLPDKSAAAMAGRTNGALKRVPPILRKTLTVDNGKEFAAFKAIERQTGLSVYFADPYSAWQRGCNENTNGLLRQYFPKGSDLSALSRSALASAVKRLNHRPRKCLGYRSPHEVFNAAINGALHR